MSRRVLIVDDAAFMRMKATKLLTENGYGVVEATNGAEAVDTYKKQQPDCVLLDITMPDMNGLDALKEIIKIDPGAKVAMVTAIGQQALIFEALKSGAIDFVVKPFNKERILVTIEKLLLGESKLRPTQ